MLSFEGARNGTERLRYAPVRSQANLAIASSMSRAAQETPNPSLFIAFSRIAQPQGSAGGFPKAFLRWKPRIPAGKTGVKRIKRSIFCRRDVQLNRGP